MTTIVKTATTSDFLALVPRLVGFQPRNSLVFVAFRGNRTCGAMRFDLPGDSSSRVHKRIATTLVGMVSKLPGVDAVVPVVYTDDAFVAGTEAAGDSVAGGSTPARMPGSEFVDSIVARLRFSGFRVRDALCVAADGWGSYLDQKCPAAGRALADIESSRVLDEVPLADRRPLGDLAEWASLPEVAPAARERVAEALAKFTAVLDGGRVGVGAGRAHEDEPRDEPADTVRAVLDDIPAMLEDIISRDSDTVDALAAAFVIAISRSPAIRDVVMLQWAFDLDLGDRVLDDAGRFARDIPAGALETAGLMLGRGPRPHPERVETAITALKSITALAPAESRAPLFCMLAWMNWALGRSSVAGLFVAEAQKVDRDYGLAELLRTVLDRAILPEWAFEVSG